MRQSYLYLSLFTLVCGSSLVFADPAPEEKASLSEEVNLSKISEAFGHLIGKNIETLGVKFDIAKVVQGIEDAMAGKSSPMSEEECVQAITAAQENLFRELAAVNLTKANQFMAQNEKEPEIKVIEKGKLHYKVQQEGNGAVVQAHFSPLIRYTGKYIDGSIFGSSKEEELISLDETIPGFTRGLIGMKEGEKRVLFIHPDLAYGTSGYLPPNSLLQFEIELVKANVPQARTDLSQKPQKEAPEVEMVTPEPEALR